MYVVELVFDDDTRSFWSFSTRENAEIWLGRSLLNDWNIIPEYTALVDSRCFKVNNGQDS